MEYQDFFFQAAIYLLAAVLSVPFAKRLGFGSVLGYLLAGIIIGPFVLGMVGSHSEDVMHFSEFGVVMMLFVIGLELRPALLWQMRGKIVGLGFLQILITTLLFAGTFKLMRHPLSESIAIGMILALSSTAMVMQIFSEKGWLKSPVGQSTLSVLLFQDIAVIPIMALFPLLGASLNSTHTTHLSLPSWQQVILSLSVIMLIILGGRYGVRPVFHYIAKSKLREIFTAASLLLVIACALVMQTIGLSPALGTFLAGAMLAESEYRHELESDIEPFKGLLLGLFFISVGASMKFSLLRTEPFLILKMVFMLLALKIIVLYALARIFKLSKQDGLLFSLALAQGGEFCFVLLAYAVQSKVLSVALANHLVLAVALSMALTPVLIILYEKKFAFFFVQAQEQKSYDRMESHEHPVIIAGFGRFGQIIARLLMANKFKVTILDWDHESIEISRQYGFKVFYGDASRMDLLETAGIQHAKLFIIAIDDSEKALEIALAVRHHHPHLKILARARGRTQLYEFYKHDFYSVYRETFGSSLAMGEEALELLGYPAKEATRRAQLFKEHDETSLKKLFMLYGKEEYLNETLQSRKNLENVMMADQEATQ